MSPEFLLRGTQQLELSTRYDGRIMFGRIDSQTPSGNLFKREGAAFPCLDTTVASPCLKNPDLPEIWQAFTMCMR